MLEEGAFSDLFEEDQTGDAASSAGGSSTGTGRRSSISFISFGASGESSQAHFEDLDQDLDESFFTGRAEELKTFSKMLAALCGGDDRAVSAVQVSLSERNLAPHPCSTSPSHASIHAGPCRSGPIWTWEVCVA